MTPAYVELRPVYVGETCTVTVTVDGTGDISGWTLSATLTDPNGTVIVGGGTATVTDGPGRKVAVAFAAQPVAGLHRFSVRRTDGDSGLVVLWGVVDITDPLA